MKQVARLAVGFTGLAAGYELGSLLTPIVGRIGFWVVTLATMFAVAGSRATQKTPLRATADQHGNRAPANDST